MFAFVLKTTLELAAIILLLIGYLNEDKVVAFERRLLKRIRSAAAEDRTSERAHSATYNAAREEALRELQERERIARNAEYARKHAALRNGKEEPRRVA